MLPQVVNANGQTVASGEAAIRLQWHTKAQGRNVRQGEKDATEERSVFLAKLGV